MFTAIEMQMLHHLLTIDFLRAERDGNWDLAIILDARLQLCAWHIGRMDGL